MGNPLFFVPKFKFNQDWSSFGQFDSNERHGDYILEQFLTGLSSSGGIFVQILGIYEF